MMRSPSYFAVACRRPDGEIVIQREEADRGILGKLKWLNKPFLRGSLALIDAMALGARALAFASNVQLSAEQQANGAAKPDASSASLKDKAEEEFLAASTSLVNGAPAAPPVTLPKSNRINDIAIGGTLVMGVLFGIMMFVLLPTAITQLLQHAHIIKPGHAHSASWLNVVDALIRMVIFFGYIGAISTMPQICEVFKYHGAEHKAINTLEAGLPLTVQNAMESSRIHPRCGTSFIFIVLVINLLVFAVLPRPAFILERFALHIAVVPIVAGIAYEVIKFAGKFRRNPLVMMVFAPGMWSQYLTTREPEPRHVEVALESLLSVLDAEGHQMRPETDPEIRRALEAEPEVALAYGENRRDPGRVPKLA